MSTLHRHWPLLLAGVSASLLLGLFWSTGLSMVTIWYQARSFSHGFLIVPLFLYLMWVRRDRIHGLLLRPNFWGLPVMAFLGCMWFLANLAEVRILQQFALIGMLVAVIWTVLGTNFVRAFRLPLAFLIFCVPFGDSMVGPLQDITAWFAVGALKISGIPVIRENRTITVPSGVWEVAEACSGIRYMVSSLVLGVVYAASVYRSSLRRVVFLVACLAVPILANGLRAYGVILLGYLWSNELASGIAHIIYGLVFFTAVECALFFAGLHWRELPAESAARPAAGFDPPRLGRAGWIAALSAVVLVGWMPAAAEHIWSRASTAETPLVSFQPLLVRAPWRPAAMYDASWQPVLQPDSQISQSYLRDEHRVDVYIAAYSGAHGLELVNGYNAVNDPIWFEEPGGTVQVVMDGQTFRLPEKLLRSPSGQRVDWIVYWVDGEYTASPWRVKYLCARARLLGRSPAAAVRP